MDYFTKLSRRIFSVVIVLALVSSSALVAMAQDQDQAAPQDQGQYQDQGRDQDQAQGQDRDQDQYPDQEQDQGQPPYPDQDQRVTSPNQGANNQPPQQQDDPRNDPPSRAARLQFTSGSVSVQPHGTDDWVTGAINRPLTNSDNIWADKNSRAEINVGTGLIRIDSESSLTLTNIGENTVQLQLHQGAMNLHVRRLYDGETYEVDSPNQSFTVLKPGDYRFDVNPDADKTVITVWRGEGEAAGDGPAVRVRQHEQARFSNGSSMTNQIHAAPSPDAFDEWAQSRDDRFDRSASSRYVSPDVVGSEDLDEYGTWRDVPQYGNVWVPSRVDAGWAPYRNGHWIWVAPWGWTWVEDEPWGYAPFHYGRWVYYDNSWGWAPGPIYVRPYYSPALVAWFGGGGWGIGFGGGYGWCPLGFGEPFIPWYGVSRGYFNRVNITNTRITNINITNVYNNRYINRGGLHGGEPVRYANMHARNGFTAVSRETLVNSRSVARNNLRVSPNELSRISPTRSLDVRPTRTTMLGANAGRSAAVPPARSFARPVVSRNNSGAFHGGPNNTGRGGELSARDNTRAVQRPGENLPNRSAGPNSNVRMTDRGSADRGSAMPRSVPRPPNAGGSAPQVRTNDGRMNQGPTNTPRNEGSNSRGNVSAPRSNSNDAPRSNERSNDRSGGPRSELSVPRPMGNMSQGGYPSSAAANRGSYSSPSNNDRSPYGGGRRSPSYGGSYSRPSPSNGGGSYSRPAPSPAPSYDRGAYGRSAPAYGGGSNGGAYGRPAPSYGGGSYSRPAPSPAPSYDRGSYGRSAPAYGGGSARSARGGSARSAPSYGGGGRSSGGYSSGGGHASAPSHSSGGGGGSHNSSNSHGGHH